MDNRISYHAGYRANERYGDIISKATCDKIFEMIENGTAEILCHQDVVISLRRAKVGFKEIYFIWDRQYRKIITFLPKESISNNQNNRDIREYASLKNTINYCGSHLPDKVFYFLLANHKRAKLVTPIYSIYENTFEGQDIYYVWDNTKRTIQDVLTEDEVAELPF